MSLQTVTRPHFSLCGINMSCMALKGGAGGALFTVLYWVDSQLFILSVFRVFVYKCIFCVYGVMLLWVNILWFYIELCLEILICICTCSRCVLLGIDFFQN